MFGKTTLWDKGGIKSLKSFKEDEKDGLWVWWSSNGKKVKEGNFKLGEKNGKWTYLPYQGKRKD